jgi:hypothetical protein
LLKISHEQNGSDEPINQALSCAANQAEEDDQQDGEVGIVFYSLFQAHFA